MAHITKVGSIAQWAEVLGTEISCMHGEMHIMYMYTVETIMVECQHV